MVRRARALVNRADLSGGLDAVSFPAAVAAVAAKPAVHMKPKG